VELLCPTFTSSTRIGLEDCVCLLYSHNPRRHLTLSTSESNGCVHSSMPPNWSREDHAPSQSRVCTRCGDVKPTDDFPLRQPATGRRHWWCQKCFNAVQRERRQRIRQAEARGVTARLARISRDEWAVVDLATRAIRRFGGVSGLLVELKQTIDDARRQRDFRVVQQGLTALLNLVLAADRIEQHGRNND
jgi:hypothetical protein